MRNCEWLTQDAYNVLAILGFILGGLIATLQFILTK